MGNVHVFNCYGESIERLLVNGHNARDIAGWSQSYTPSSRVVPRTKAREDSAAFAIGDNELAATWVSFTGTATIAIPDPRSGGVSLDDPLLLFLAVNEAILLTTRGYVLQTFEVRMSMGGSTSES